MTREPTRVRRHAAWFTSARVIWGGGHPVGYVEGWFVDPDLRRQGVGKALLAAAEGWASSQGCREMASDAHLENAAGIAAHRALGFQDEPPTVRFRKWLPTTDGVSEAGGPD